jgi:hypothetical protein
MKNYFILGIFVLSSCGRVEEDCNISETLFPKPSKDALLLELDDIWVYSDSVAFPKNRTV